MTGRLAGSAVVVTGGAAGLGLAYARRFLREGACVFIADIVDPARSRASTRATGWAAVRVDGLRRVGGRDDGGGPPAPGRIYGLINNAAVFASLKPQTFDAIPEEEWDRVMAVNVRGMWNCVKAVAPVMRAQKGGRIVNVASAIVAKGPPFLLHYVASKGAVIAMTRALARELGDDGIAVNAVAPGLILSDTVRANPAVTSFQSAAVLQSRAFKRDAVPEDVEGAVVFLASPDSAFMTGQTLVVDGGSVFV